jgi:amino acid adenylation domain-containing protein
MAQDESARPSAGGRAAGLSADRLALLQRRLAAKNKAARAEPAVAVPDGAPVLSFGQERLWLIDQLQPGNPAYNVPLVLPLGGTLDVALLRRCLEEIVRRHEVVRTNFVFRGDAVIPQVRESVAVPFEWVQLAREGGETEAEALARLCNAQIRIPFTLGHGPLLRAALIRLDRAETEYRLVVTLHHIVCDAWSLGLLVDELRTLYAASAEGKPSPLPELPVQYADFAAWQRRQLEGEPRDRLLRYWKTKLAGAPPLLDLPSDRPRPARSSFLGGTHMVSLDPDTSRKLKAIGASRGCTLFVTGLSLFAALLQRYSATDDLVIGTPIAMRDKPEYEPLIGFFLNTLALRIRLGGAPTFHDLLERVREEFFNAFAHKDLPFEMLVAETKTRRSAQANPIFQVMFSLQNRAPGAAAGAGEGPLPIDTGFSRFDLSLSIVETDQSLEGTFEYSRDLFDEATIVRMGEHLRLLADAVAADPERPLSQFELLTSYEIERFEEWNATSVARDGMGCIHEIFAAQAERTPAAEAMRFGEERLTYAELDARANRLAWHLRERGAGPERIVGLFMERSLDTIVSLLAVLKAGAAYLPLDPAYPEERLAFMIADAGVDLVLTQTDLRGLVPGAATVIAVDEIRASLTDYPGTAPASGVHPDNAAYVIYTSGSTGMPKGVVVPHRGAVNAAEVEAEVLEIRPGDRILQFASLNFDASMYELLMWMRGGATLVVAAADDIMPGFPLLETVRTQAVTVMSLPPSALAAVPVEELPSLRLITVMGEACPPELVARWRSVTGRIFNAYGPTETSMWVAGTDLDGTRPTTIGRPIANNRIYLLDRYLNRVPVGVVGELYIGGVAVARGYLRQPRLTAERFIPDPHGKVAGARLYRTGDLARYLADGEIEYLGRGDHQVKIRGFRVELGEVEAALCRHPAVRNAAAMVVDQPSGGRLIVAYVASAEPGLDEAELRRFVQRSLPAHAVPSRVAIRESLPLSESGKVARKELPAIDLSFFEPSEAFVAPGAGVQQTVAQIWCRVLGLQRVGLDDNFFELGGHSLAAAQISARLRDAFSCDVAVSDILEGMTVRAIAAMIEARVGMSPPAPPPAPSQKAVGAASVAEGEQAAVCPLSYAQERLWFLAQMEPNSRAYNIPTGLSLPAPVDEGALRRALDEVARRHEPLRTCFADWQGEPVQLIHAHAALPLAVTDMRGIAEAEYTGRLAQIAATEANHGFDLAHGPLVRAHLVLVDGPWALLFLTVHHIVADGWSVGVLTGEVAALYNAFSSGQPSPLPELESRYRDFVAWQRAQLAGGEAETLLDYWRRQLSGAPVLALPHDRPRTARRDARGGQHRFTVGAEVAERVNRIAIEGSTTAFVVFLAAFNILLRAYAQQDDILVGTPVANRARAQDEALIGLFVNPLALRTDLSGNPSFREVVQRVKDVVLAALAHQNLPFERLVAELAPERIENANPLFQVFFAYLSQGGGDAQSVADNAVTGNKFDISLHLLGTANGVAGGFEYDQTLFDASTIDRMAANFLAVLEAVAADVDSPLDALQLLAPAEQSQRDLWNATAVEWPIEACLHELIDAQALRTPDLPAVLLDEETLSYAELVQRANALSARFARRGAGPGARIGIHMERSLDLIVALLAVLKTGASYMPLDATYPAQRLAHMIADARVAFVVTGATCSALEGCDLVSLPLAADDSAEEGGALPEGRADLDATAYLIYTSGSTGRPKGVMNSHRGVVNRILWMQQAYPIGPGDRVLQKTPISFDVSVWELFWPLMTGATLVFARPDGHRDSAYLVRMMAEQKISHVHFVPSMLRQFLDEPGGDALPCLKRVFCSGEALPRGVEERFHPRTAELHNLYGPTEAAIDVTAWHCCAADRRQTVPIGRPVANTEIHILDRAMNLVPIGAFGEIYIGGVQVAQGYWNRPGLTAGAFVPDRFSERPGARLYRTGDIGRFLADGAIEYFGRVDRQIKIRGFRVEPGEIEAGLARHPAVRDAIVLCRSDGAGEAQLVAYVCPREGAAIDAGALSDLLAETLPAHMVPSAFVTIESIPLSPNGKRDISALPPPPGIARPSDTFVEPTTGTEKAVARIWAEVLQREDIGAADNFFRLGGQSLQVMRVLARVREAMPVEISAVQFFQAPTVAGLAALVDEARGDAQPRLSSNADAQ